MGLQQRAFTALPYVLILAIAAWFFHIAGHIEYSMRPGQIGPDFWPRLALALMVVICVFQVGRVMLYGTPSDKPSVEVDTGESEEEAPRRPSLLIAGIVLTVAYGVFINVFGFPLITFVYMILFMYLGGYRGHVSLWLSSLIGVLGLTIVFQSVVYVSLPRGQPPFDAITDFLVRLFG
jgi:hypothetical protein